MNIITHTRTQGRSETTDEYMGTFLEYMGTYLFDSFYQKKQDRGRFSVLRITRQRTVPCLVRKIIRKILLKTMRNDMIR